MSDLFRILLDFKLDDMHPKSFGYNDYGVVGGLMDLFDNQIVGKEVKSFHPDWPNPTVLSVGRICYVARPKHPTIHVYQGGAIHPVFREAKNND